MTPTSPAGPAGSLPGAPPPRLRGKLAALSILGGLLAGLPLTQVLRYQNAELEAIAHQRTGLDPVLHAVGVQRGLLVHRDLAARVLRGTEADESERRVRQGEVDDRVAQLAAALQAGAWDRALRECDALHEDWLLLARGIAARSLQPAESDHAHRLLVEQALQVVDLLAEASGNTGVANDDAGWGLLRAARTLPRLAWQTASLARPGVGRDAAGQARDLAAAEAGVARVLGALNAALERPAVVAAGTQQLLARATATAGAAADRYFQALRSEGLPADELHQAAEAAVQAQFALFSQAQGALTAALDERAEATARQQARLVSTMAVLALLVLLVVSRLARATAPVPPAPAHDDPGPPPAPADRLAAGELLRRLGGRAAVVPVPASSDAPAVPAVPPVDGTRDPAA